MEERPEKMFVYEDTPSGEEDCYETADYARNGLLDVFTREGKHSEVKQILEQVGHLLDDDSTMDPMEILIILEKHGGYE